MIFAVLVANACDAASGGAAVRGSQALQELSSEAEGSLSLHISFPYRAFFFPFSHHHQIATQAPLWGCLELPLLPLAIITFPNGTLMDSLVQIKLGLSSQALLFAILSPPCSRFLSVSSCSPYFLPLF